MATINPWKAFQGLLPKASRMVGTVASHNSNGTTTITLHNGSSITVKGHGVIVGSKALVEDGEVKREVPDLPFYTVHI